jgi:uncharacterized iron-regulated membrane protein
MLRKVFFWTHLAAGVTAGAVILIMSVTGVLLTYERQMTEWADGYVVTKPAPDAVPLGVEQLAAAAREGRRGELASITLRKAPAPAAFAFGREGTVFLDPYTGRVLGEGSARARAFFRSVTDWHRWLAASGDSRPTGRAVTGASNLVFLLIVLSGIVLWWPKGLSWKRLRPVTLFQGGLSGKARDFNWHNVFGFWSAMPLAVIVAGGVVISYPWATDLVYRLTGSQPPRRPVAAPGGPGGPGARPGAAAAGGERGGASPTEARPPVPLDGLDRAWATAASQVPGWQSLTLRVPNAPDAPFAFTIDTWAAARQPSTRSQLVVGRDGQVVRSEPYASQSRGAKVRGWLRFLHTGEAFGVVGQTIAGLASAGAVMLVWTGVTLALRRLAAWRRRRARARESAPAQSDAATA